MTKLTLSIPSFTGGVSTQPEPLRLPQQANRSDNAVASVVEGLKTRPPTEFVSTLSAFPTAPVVIHSMETADGNYIVAAGNQSLTIYDRDGSGSPLVLRNTNGAIATSSDLSYLQTSDPENDLKFLTLSEYTLVLNRTKVTAGSANSIRTLPNQAIVQVNTGAYSKEYRIRVSHSGGDSIEVGYQTYGSDGSTPAAPTTPGSTGAAEATVKTEHIATQLESLLRTGNTTGIVGGTVYAGNSSGLPPQRWTVTRSGSVIRVVRLDGTDFTFEVSDSSGDNLMRPAYKSVQLFSDLPAHAPHGMKIKVEGDPSNEGNDYWAEFIVQGQTPVPPAAAASATNLSTWGDGYWRESVAPGVRAGLDESLMPHVLIRQADGEWQFTSLDGLSYIAGGQEYPVPSWGWREAGDLESNEDPSFVGEAIRDMVFHEGRLCLLSENALTMSATREPFTFFRSSVIDTIDTDRIDLESNRARSERMSHVVSMGADLTIFGDSIQYIIRSDGPVTPTSVSMIEGGRYKSNPNAQPIRVAGSLFVPTERSGRGCVHEMRVSGERRPTLEKVDLTASVPGYLGSIRKLLTSPQLEMVVATSADDESLYVYTHYFNGGERVMQAWQRWTFRGDPEIRGAWFDDTDLWLICNYFGSYRLLKIRCAPYESDGDSTLVYLDERIDQTQCSSISVANNNTVCVFPFTPTSGLRVIEKETAKEIRVVSINGTSVTLAGIHTLREFWAGQPIEFRHDLSRIHRFGEDQSPVISPELHLDTLSVHYTDSGPFEVVVMTDDGQEAPTRLMGPYLGLGADYESMRMTSGRLKVGVRSRSDISRISFRSTEPWPVRLVSMDVEARELRQHGARR